MAEVHCESVYDDAVQRCPMSVLEVGLNNTCLTDPEQTPSEDPESLSEHWFHTTPGCQFYAICLPGAQCDVLEFAPVSCQSEQRRATTCRVLTEPVGFASFGRRAVDPRSHGSHGSSRAERRPQTETLTDVETCWPRCELHSLLLRHEMTLSLFSSP